jgi:thiol:disulfide interchange protein DsbC
MRWGSLLIALLLLNPLWAGEEIPASVYNLLQQELQDLRLTGINPRDLDIQPTDDPAYYQTQVGSFRFHISADGSFAMRSPFFDDNVSEADKRAARSQAIKALDPASAIIFSPAYPPLYRLTVFTDVDCPFCARFHGQIPRLLAAGVEVRYLAFPRALDTKNHADNAAIWCSLNPHAAFDAAFSGVNVTARKCDNPVAAHYTLGESFGIDGTPALVFDDGSLYFGYYDAIHIVQYLRGERDSLGAKTK